MKYLFLFLFLAGCTGNEKTLLFECNDQNQGQACFKLAKARKGEEALPFYRRGCELGSVDACGELLTQGLEKEKVIKSLESFCAQGNKRACEKAKSL